MSRRTLFPQLSLERHQSHRPVCSTYCESWFILILSVALRSLVSVFAFLEWGGLPRGVRLWWHQHPQCLCAFWYLGGRHQEKGPTWAEKKEKYVYCLLLPCSVVCFSLYNPIEIPQNQTVWFWVMSKLKCIFFKLYLFWECFLKADGLPQQLVCLYSLRFFFI